MEPISSICASQSTSFEPDSCKIDDTEMDEIASEMYERVRKRQVPLMNLPEATLHEQSAFGQLILLGYANSMMNL